jgi:hypothetical protein
MARGFETTTGLVIQQGIFEESSTAKHKIGTRMQLADGRVFYYGSAGEALGAGLVCASPNTPSGQEDMTVAAAVAAGDYIISAANETTAITANLFDEGYLVTRETGGVGQTLKIKKHTTATATGTPVFTLYDPCLVALTTASEIDVMGNPFKGVTSAADEETNPAGVPLIAVTDAYYAWLQTWGTVGVLCGGAIPVGCDVVLGTNGAVVVRSTQATSLAAALFPTVGVNIGAAGVDTKYTHIALRLYP